MDLSEENGIHSSFYFFGGRTNHKYDAKYELDKPQIKNLIKEIHKRGHNIGLHPSYDTYKESELIKKEADYLKNICNK